jgi:predicted dehydrogenase
VKGVIVGFGTIAMGHAIGYSQVADLDVVAVVDPSQGRRTCATHRFGLRSYASFAEMLARETPDFIDVCTPPSSHAEYLRLGMTHGLHVLCEKPVLLPTESGYDDLLAEIRSSDQIVYPCHNYKFAPILGLMENVVGTPEFGTVLSAKFRTLRSGHAVGVPDWNPDWRRDPAISGGGIVRDHGPHSIYLATHLTGRTPVAVSCLTGNLRRDRYTETEDTAMLTIRCDDDVQIMLDLTWSAGFRNSYYSVIGSNGSVVVENDDVCYTIGGDVQRTVLASNFDDPSHTDWFRQMFLDFLDKVAHPEQLNDLLQEALMTSLVIDSAYASAADGGRWVDVELPIISRPAYDAQR